MELAWSQVQKKNNESITKRVLCSGDHKAVEKAGDQIWRKKCGFWI